jgi:cytochrome c
MILSPKLQVEISIAGLIVLVCFTMAFTEKYSENNRPEVRIISPVNNSVFQLNSNIPYAIQVIDKEDGDSRYNEILNNEVLLQVSYWADSLLAANYVHTNADEKEPPAITLMRTSTCFNCHTMQKKLIGPAFNQIANKYSNNEESVTALTRKVMHGSKGTWGDTPMPSNSDFTPDQINMIIRWLLTINKESNVFYQAGLKGTLQLPKENDKIAQKGVYVLTASYIDHGINNNQNMRRKGQHSILIKPITY